MRRSVLVVLILAIMLLASPPSIVVAHHAEGPPPISTNAQAAALIDVGSGRILYSHHGDERLLIASLTKIMTAIVAIEHGHLEDIVKVSRNAVGKEGSSIYLKEGQEISLLHLLYGLLLRSGNDAATAIAEHVGGSEQGFVFMMNAKAAELGLTNTSFMNPHGLDMEGHYSSAEDLARLTAYALKNPTFREIVSTRVKRVPNPGEKWDHVWYNKNKMLTLYEGADGVKTGYTKAAGRGLVSSATRDGRQLAAVTINDGSDWVDHARLLEWGFRYFANHRLIAAGEAVQDTPYVAARSFYYPLYEGEIEHITHEVMLEEEGTVDYRLGELGRVNFYLEGQFIGSVPLGRKPNEVDSSAPAAANDSYITRLRQVVIKLFTLR